MTRAREDRVAVGGLWLGQLGQDLRFGVRTLLRDRVFAVSAILTLGLATGATTAVFSLVNGLLLRPLPFPAAERLVSIHGRNWSEDRGASPDPMTAPVGSLEIEALQHSRSFEAIAGYFASTRHLESSGGVERVRIVAADRAFFDVLNVGPIVGRTFRSDDPSSVAVISERAWRQRFGGDPRVVERTVTLDGVVFSIVGVMPESFEFPYYRANSSVASMPSDGRTEVWVPLPPLRAAAGGKPRGGRVEVVARLEPQTTLHQAGAELTVMAGQIEAEHYRGTPTRSGMRTTALVDDIIAPVQSSLWLLFAAVGLVLAAACANVASLLLARMLRRAREVVTRAALGASGLRLVRQFLAESLLLSLAGGVVGAVIASWGTEALLGFYRGRLPRLHEVSLDWQAFVFLLLACTVAAALVGMAPALAAARTNPHEATKTAGGHATMGRRTRLVRDGLVIVEVMLAFVLAVAVALVLREINRLHNVPTGMSVVENVVVLHLTPRTTPADYRAIEERVAALAGARAAGFIQFVPLQNSGWLATFQVRGRPASTAERLTTDLRYVTAGYFQAAGIPIVGGRNFTSGDTAGAPPVVLVNETFARRYFHNEDAVGRELNRGTIVGVVGDVRSAALGQRARARALLSRRSESGDGRRRAFARRAHGRTAGNDDWGVASGRGGGQPEARHFQREDDAADRERIVVAARLVSLADWRVRGVGGDTRGDRALCDDRLRRQQPGAGVRDPPRARIGPVAHRAADLQPRAGALRRRHHWRDRRCAFRDVVAWRLDEWPEAGRLNVRRCLAVLLLRDSRRVCGAGAARRHSQSDRGPALRLKGYGSRMNQ